ncbi:hypothetical protein NUU61_002159 [Penicillium alfredii]|uniref:Uncharacterized protein n=1 Tax=Penicillium alfredii TaxID=1506179 RepID=A0A9W9FRQ4_9EURO|nr:uncharacterized protein NUU61_002159 [Penicillium alfredii]KAJ5104812.1 hypothetical protein NUU61_002159 [Penicillium alfredii]
MFSSFSTQDRLRRSMSTRSMRKSRRPPEPETIDPELAKYHAAAAASHAMRSSERSSTDSGSSYNRLGGPGSVAIPRRRPGSSLQRPEDGMSVDSHAIPLPRQSMETSGAAPQHHYLDDPAVLPPITEFKGLDGRDCSQPSSYRRLRKAKSMFSTRQRTSHVTHGPLSAFHGDHPDPERSPELPMQRTLRRSMSFLRGGQQQSSQDARQAKSHDAALQLARSQYLQEPGGLGTQPRRSSFFISRNKREHKPFRKTFRATSEGGIGAPPPSELPSPRHSQSKSRAFSVSFKRGLKRVFGLSRTTEQQYPSHTSSNNATIPAENIADHHYDSHFPNAREKGVHGVSYTPSQTMRNSPSRDSLCAANSRVTSWADSTVANTVKTRRTGHRQSLCLIEEHGDLSQQLPQMPVTHTAERQSPFVARPISRQVQGSVDSQDLYSALMRQIGRNAFNESDDEVIFGTVPEHRVIPERTSSIYSQRSRRTIRHVPSEESLISPGSFATAHGGDSLTPQRHHSRPASMSYLSAHERNQHIPTALTKRSPYAEYTIGEESDEDNGSVIIAHSEESQGVANSPSVYSRTTGDNTPTKDNKDGIFDESDAYEEPGTATIFASQRSTYNSPKRVKDAESSKAQVHPSADWQQWMTSQIERIEKTTPTREHFREQEQLEDDDDKLFAEIARQVPAPSRVPSGMLNIVEGQGNGNLQPSAENPLLPQSNFSRPFSRTSSVRTIMPRQRAELVDTIKISSKDSRADLGGGPTENASPGSGDRVMSPVRLRSGNLLPAPESPTPKRGTRELPKRAWTQEQYRRYSARRPPVAPEGKPNQFRSMRNREFRGMTNENVRQKEDIMMEDYHQGQEPHGTISSKHMVEMFLNSRSRQMETGMSGNTADGAFL